MTQSGYLLLGLTAIVGAAVGTVTFTLLRAFAAARDITGHGRDRAGAETAFMAVAMEEAMSRLKLREQALAERAEASERLSDEIITSLASGLLVVGPDHRVQAFNPFGRRLLQLPDTGWTGDVTDVLRTAQPLAAVIQECLDTRQAVRRRTVQIDTNPERPTHLGVTVSPVSSRQGQPRGAICLFGDLTDIVELEEQLRLKDSLAQLGELTAGIAHEFRNGLATIHGYARLARSPAAANRHARLRAGNSRRDRRARRRRPQLPQLRKAGGARARHGRLRAPWSSEPPTRSVPKRRRMAAPSSSKESTPPCRATRSCSARRSATCAATRSRPVVDARLQPHIVIECLADPAQHQVRVSVIDNGPGVDPKIASRIFRPFVTTRARGTGLGLALVQKIVVTHNGRVGVQAEPGGGTRFTVTLPLAG